MARSTQTTKMKAFFAVVTLYSVLSIVAVLCFNELFCRTSVFISIRNHCASDDKRCKSYSNLQDVVVKLTTASVEGESTTRQVETTARAERARLAEWIGSQGYKTYKSKKTLQRQCNSCSIVNSGGRLLGSKVGDLIDKADCVIRMNTAPTLKYKVDVGSRTTFRVVGHRNLPNMMKKAANKKLYLDDVATRSDIVIVWHYGWNVTDKKALDKFCRTSCLTHVHAAVYLSGEEVMKRNEVMFYKELNITNEHPNDTQPYHYYDKAKRECAYYSRSETDLLYGHKYFTEKAVFAKWANMYGITFHEPSWTGRVEGYTKDTEIDSLFYRKFMESEHRKMLESKKLPSTRTEVNSSGTRVTEAQI